LIKAGEASGKLDTFMEKIVVNLEKKEKIKSQIKSAFFYPGVLLTVALSVSVFMLTNVVPTFVEMYENMGMGDNLPGATKTIMAMSAFVSDSRGLITLLVLLAFVVIFKICSFKKLPFKKSMASISF
jgi:type IV pilus assembly protein PilC